MTIYYFSTYFLQKTHPAKQNDALSISENQILGPSIKQARKASSQVLSYSPALRITDCKLTKIKKKANSKASLLTPFRLFKVILSSFFS
jgi:hypothetical protein